MKFTSNEIKEIEDILEKIKTSKSSDAAYWSYVLYNTVNKKFTVNVKIWK